ncbi:MAG TPA: glycosyltransferase 87 family protein, partial [Rugosimonospora sp.]|nr:glycosyltransferase 87 family protein [Rugosimonospora sp.]
TAVGATALAAVVTPGASRAFWTGMLWHTQRVGSLSYVSNQSLMGLVARLDPVRPDRLGWGAAVVLVLGVWVYRGHRAAVAGDAETGFALAGTVACLVSPVTWVHHLVWLIPALVRLADGGLRADPGRRLAPLAAAIVAYTVLSSSVVWLWSQGPDALTHPAGVAGFLGGNAYVWVCLALLCGLPVRGQAADPPSPMWTAGGRAALVRHFT